MQGAKAVAVQLADFADDGGRDIWPNVARVAYGCELLVRTMQRILEKFVAEGLLVVMKAGGGRPGSSTRYDVDLLQVRARSSALAETGDSVSPSRPVTLCESACNFDPVDGRIGVQF